MLCQPHTRASTPPSVPGDAVLDGNLNAVKSFPERRGEVVPGTGRRRTTIRLSDVGKILGWSGLAGVAACLLLRYVEPAPRWDVLTSLGISLLGLTLSWAGTGTGTGTRHTAARVEEVPTAPAPVEPAGFRLVEEWRPARTQRQHLGVLLMLLSVALLMFGSAQHVTPQLADARSGSARIVAVTVAEVTAQRSTPVRGGGTTYTSGLSVKAPEGTTGNELLRGSIKTSDSVRPNDELWALYTPGTGKEAAQLTETRGELKALRDGGTRPSGMLLGVCAAAAALGLVLLLRRKVKPYQDEQSVAETLHTSGTQALAVTLAGTAEEGTRELGVGLHLQAEDGERRLHISRFVDMEHLADLLYGRTGWLYWARPDGDPPRGRPGRKGEMLPAVLVVGGGGEARYVRGWMPREPEWPVAQGRRLGATSPESCPAVRQLGSGAMRPPRARPGALVWLGLAGLAAAATAAFPVGGGGKELVQTAGVVVVLCAVVGMRLREAKWRPVARRQERRTAEPAA